MRISFFAHFVLRSLATLGMTIFFAGFWIEQGEIQYAVHEVTISGNLPDMFNTFIAVGNDVDKRGNIQILSSRA